MFGNGPYQNWLEFFPAIRSDLYFVMDDSWEYRESAPATVSRHMALPIVEDTTSARLYVLASTYAWKFPGKPSGWG